MKDLVFTGPDVAAALAEASRTLGLPVPALRHVVLDPGRPERLGVRGEPARVAVMIDRPAGARGAAPSPPLPSGPPPADVSPAAVVEALARAAGLELWLEQEPRGSGLSWRLGGSGTAALLEDDAEAVSALEHLLQRAAAFRGEERRVTLECEGYRERRDARLRERALALAAAVRADGVPRETEPLNSYERRLVHVAVAEVAGLATFSVGEGADRRVTIAPAPPADGSPA
jgi:spoIIIJ-associated protein